MGTLSMSLLLSLVALLSVEGGLGVCWAASLSVQECLGERFCSVVQYINPIRLLLMK